MNSMQNFRESLNCWLRTCCVKHSRECREEETSLRNPEPECPSSLNPRCPCTLHSWIPVNEVHSHPPISNYQHLLSKNILFLFPHSYIFSRYLSKKFWGQMLFGKCWVKEGFLFSGASHSLCYESLHWESPRGTFIFSSSQTYWTTESSFQGSPINTY